MFVLRSTLLVRYLLMKEKDICAVTTANIYWTLYAPDSVLFIKGIISFYAGDRGTVISVYR